MTATADPELLAEQRYIDHAYACLERMRARAAALVGESEDPDLEHALERRVRLLTDNGRVLCFGRIDEEDGPSWYIGRRHVEDDKADPVVVEWRAPIAVPFYRATTAAPLGLTKRRQFIVDQRKLLTMADDIFAGAERDAGRGAGASDNADGAVRVRGREALLAELDRSRTGEMLDIVATIQGEQDEVIRAELDGVLAVQGGPGTGKTAIGLHRAAYLLYAHPPLARSGVLVIGPNKTFLRYIAQVLPSLGEEAVVQTTMRDLLPKVRVRAVEPPEAQRVKGDVRMAEVLARALADRRRPLDGELVVRFGVTRLMASPDELDAVVGELTARRAPYDAGRKAVRERVLRVLYRRYCDRVGQLSAVPYTTVATAVRRDPAFTAAIDRLWPAISAVALVRELLSSPTRLARAADGILDAGEQAAILRPPVARVSGERWCESDVALLDEAQELLTGAGRTYGHIVADEAQDLSPMQLRMLARRSTTGSITILGDLAQGASIWAHDEWDELIAHLRVPQGWRRRELRLGYRTPGQVLELANRLLPVAAPTITPTESVRPGRTAPIVRVVDEGALFDDAAAEAARLSADYGSVAVIVAGPDLVAADKALAAAGVDFGEAERDGLGHPITLVTATGAKGLEFDAVVVVEPAAIVADAPRGLRLLYVAMTRPTQHLTMLHSRPLPAPL